MRRSKKRGQKNTAHTGEYERHVGIDRTDRCLKGEEGEGTRHLEVYLVHLGSYIRQIPKKMGFCVLCSVLFRPAAFLLPLMAVIVR